MLSKPAIITFLVALANITMASPLQSTSEISDMAGFRNGTQLVGRSTEKEIVCDPYNQADRDLCQRVLDDLKASDVKGEKLYRKNKKTIRSICQNEWRAGAIRRCCVSWSEDAKELTYKALLEEAQAIFDQCQDKKISGERYAIRVGEGCTNVCMSDRDKHCL